MEFKAHMSIHDFVSVPEPGTGSSRYTRDRLGKTHEVRAKGAGGRTNVTRKTAAALAALIFLPSLVFVSLAYADAQKKSTNVQVDSRDLEPFSMDDRIGKREQKPQFYKDEEKTIGINDDGDPNVSMRF